MVILADSPAVKYHSPYRTLQTVLGPTGVNPLPEPTSTIASTFTKREDEELSKLGSFFTEPQPFVISLYRPPDVGHGWVLDGPDSFETCVSDGVMGLLAAPIHTIQPEPVTSAQIDAYLTGNAATPQVFAKMKALYEKRFPNLTVQQSGNVPEGTLCSVCSIRPLPDADSVEQRRPSFGLAYTFADACGNFDLAAAACLAGEKLLQIRLKLVLENRHCLQPECHGSDTPLDFARDLSSSSVTFEHYTYLAMKLLLAHHLFFPSSPVVLQLFQKAYESSTVTEKKLKEDYSVAGILARHGMQPYSLRAIPHEVTIASLAAQALEDTVYLVSRTKTSGALQDTSRLSREEIRSEIRESVTVALALLCSPTRKIKTKLGQSLHGLNVPAGLDVKSVQVYLPVFTSEKLTDQRWDDHAIRIRDYFESLNPDDVGANSRPYQGMGWLWCQNGEQFSKVKKKADTELWHLKYARAKFTRDLHLNEEFPPRKAATTQSSGEGKETPPVESSSEDAS